VFLVFYRLLKENCGFYVEVPISDKNCKSLLERSSVNVLERKIARSSAHVLEPRTVTIKHKSCIANGSLMYECAQAHQLCDRAHMSDLATNFSFIKVVNPSFSPINR
jgi:hypothetical protein